MEKIYRLGTRVKIDNHETGTIIGGDKDFIYVASDKMDSITKIPLDENLFILKPELSYAPKKKVYVTKEMTFDSCHNLLEYDGDCARLHGHTYKIQVTLGGECDDRGFLVDFKDLKKVMKEIVVDRCDHRYLNDLMPFNTTAENMVKFYFDLLTYGLIQLYGNESRYIRLESVKLWETPTSYAEYRGECY